MASLVAGVVAASMLTFTAGSAASAGQPVSAGAVQTAEQEPSARKVLSNDFGAIRSAIQGSFGKNGVVTGTFKPRRFIQEDGQLMAVGLLTATLTRGSGKVVGTTEKVVTLPVRAMEGASAQATCQILRLVLGPLNLNLLGLRVTLNRVVLNITAEPGPGNLLGNLLCAVAGLLDNQGVLTQIRQILNSILGILRL